MMTVTTRRFPETPPEYLDTLAALRTVLGKRFARGLAVNGDPPHTTYDLSGLTLSLPSAAWIWNRNFVMQSTSEPATILVFKLELWREVSDAIGVPHSEHTDTLKRLLTFAVTLISPDTHVGVNMKHIVQITNDVEGPDRHFAHGVRLVSVASLGLLMLLARDSGYHHTLETREVATESEQVRLILKP